MFCPASKMGGTSSNGSHEGDGRRLGSTRGCSTQEKHSNEEVQAEASRLVGTSSQASTAEGPKGLPLKTPSPGEVNLLQTYSP